VEKVYHVANEFLKISNDQDCFDMNPMNLNRLVYEKSSQENLEARPPSTWENNFPRLTWDELT
jgi:hypothetical protein